MNNGAIRPFERDYVERVRSHLEDRAPPGVGDRAAEYAELLISAGLPVLFDQQHLGVVTGVQSQVIGTIRRDPDRFYSTFRIAKRDGGSRLVRAPTPALKRIQGWLQRNLTSALPVHPAAHGFVRGRSILTNAAPHVGSTTVMKLDILDFFGSVRRGRVVRIFRRAGYSKTVAKLLADLTTLDGALPQGAPTSPDLANRAAHGLDVRLCAYAERHDITYTRYADDLTFSGVLYPENQRTIEYIMRDEDFAPNEHKLRYLLPAHRQAVTGVVTNVKLNWPRWRRRWVRQEVYYLAKFGVEDHLAARGISRRRYKEFIYGHVYALHAVDPQEAAPLLETLDQVDWPY